MELVNLKSLISTKNIPSFLIFTGEEWKVQQLYITQISKVLGAEVKRVDSISEVWNKIGMKSLLSQKRLYLLRDDKELLTNEKVQSNLFKNLNGNYLILLLTNPDKRIKFLKTNKDIIVNFDSLHPELLKKYLKKVIDLSERNLETLMQVCEYNYGNCLLEIDKIWKYVDYHINPQYTVDLNKVFEKLLQDGTIYIPPQDVIFDFVKMVLKNKPLQVYGMLRDLKANGEPTLVILSVLYNNTKHLLQVQSCTNSDVAKTTGLSGWQIKNAKECVGSFKTGELVYLLRLIQRVEKEIKTGLIPEELAVEYVLASFL